MTLAAVARLSRRHLPVMVTPSRLGGARTAACVHEPGRLPSPASRHHLGRLLLSTGHQLDGALRSAPFLQSQRFVSSELNKTLGSPGAAKSLASVDHACIAEEYVSLLKELEETSENLDRELVFFKNTLIVVIGLACTAFVSFPMQLTSMRSEYKELTSKMRKRHVESERVLQEAEADRSAAVELQKWFAEEKVKKSGNHG